MKACMGSLVLAVTFVALMHVRSIYSSPIEMKLLMPDVAPKTKDIYLCHKFKMDEERPVYITQFEANSSAAIAHHILLFACKDTVEEEVWNCGEMAASTEDRQFKSGPVCLSQQSIVFAWALDAPKLQLPEDVAFKLGGNTDKKYLVMQIHYADVERFKNGETDNSGLVLKGQTEPVKNLAAVYFSATGGQIKPGETETFDAVCEIDEDVVMHPFAYRTHAHKLGIVNSGYLVRTDEVTGEQTWTEIGRRSPQLPQMFFPVSNHVEIRKGDIVASRCTMHNTRDHVVHIGSTGNDEMCNFYMMYYVKGEHLLDNNICFSSGPPFFHLNKFKSSNGVRLDMDKLPADASSVPDNQLAELEEMKKNGHGMHGAHGQSSAAKAEDDMPMKEMNMEHMDASKSQHHRMGHQQMMPADQEDTEQSSRSLDSVELTKDDIINHLEDLERELRLRRLIQKFNLQDNN